MPEYPSVVTPTPRLNESAETYSAAPFTGLSAAEQATLQAVLGVSFQRTFYYSAVGMVLSDMQGNYRVVNPAICRMLECNDSDLLGHSYMDFTHPDDQTHIERHRKQIAAGEIQSFTTEKRYITKTGRNVAGLLTVTLITTADNQPLWLLGHVQDISSLRQSEQALRDSEAHYRAIVEDQTELVCRFTPDTVLTFVNSAYCHYFDSTPAELIGTSFLTLLPEEDRERVRVVFEDLSRNPHLQQNTHLVIVRDGQLRWQEWTNRPIMDAQGQVVEFQSVGRDVTRRKQAEDAEREQRELAEALRDTASALSSTLDYEKVLDQILENAQHVVHYDAANILLLDEGSDETTLVRARGYAELGLSDWVKQVRLTFSDFPHLVEMKKTGQPIVIPDTSIDADWVQMPGDRWLLSFAGVPIFVRGQFIGWLGFDSKTPGYFRPSDAARLQAFADQAAIAIENSQLYQTERDSAARMMLLHEAALELAHTDSLPSLYRETLHWARRLTSANMGALLRFDGISHLHVVAVAGAPDTMIGTRIALGEGLNGTVAQSRQSKQVTDYQGWSNHIPFYAKLGMTSAIAFPLVWQDRLIGTLSVTDNNRHEFSSTDIHILDLYCSLVASAIEQRIAVLTAREAVAEANALSARLSRAQEDERARIAEQLHDSIGYRLVELGKSAEIVLHELGDDHPQAERMRSSLTMLMETHELARTLATDLSTHMLADLGLSPTARQYIQRLADGTGVDIRLHTTGRFRRLPADIERVAFRGMQECLMNALRHARASEISAHIHFGARALRLTVQDNGQGFDPTASLSHGTALGFPDIQRQVKALHGEISVDSTPMQGTLIELRLPLRGMTTAEKTKLRVLVVDDHETTREGLRMLLSQSEDFTCVGEASDGISAVNMIDLNRPELVLMDIRMPGLTGIDAVRVMLQRYPQLEVVIFTSYVEEAYLQQAFQLGARGFVLKTDANQSVLDALRAAHAGERYVSPQLRAVWERLQRQPLTNDPLEPLSRREREVFRMVIAGNTSLKIAEKLGLVERTVEVYRRSIKTKLGLNRLAQWMDFAGRHRLLEH